MRREQSGFTLVELLVALAITSVLVVLLLSVVSGTLNIWRQGTNQIDTFSDARQVLNRMADEIRGALASGQVEFSENLTTIAFTTGGPSPTPNPQPTPQPTKSENIFFVAPYPNDTAGDLCVIAYRHIDTDTNPQSNNSHTLQRAFIDSQGAWNGGAANRYQSVGYGSFNWRTIARGVLEFEIQSYSQADLNATPAPTPAPTWNSVSGTSLMLANVPRRVVIRIKVIDDNTEARLNLVPLNSSSYNLIISQSARQFTADVSLLPPH